MLNYSLTPVENVSQIKGIYYCEANHKTTWFCGGRVGGISSKTKLKHEPSLMTECVV